AAATFTLLMFGARLSLWTRGALAVWTIASLWAWGALLEAKSWGVALEATRLLFACVAGAVWMRSAGLPAHDVVPAFGVAVSSMFWLFRLCAAWSWRDECNNSFYTACNNPPRRSRRATATGCAPDLRAIGGRSGGIAAPRRDRIDVRRNAP